MRRILFFISLLVSFQETFGQANWKLAGELTQKGVGFFKNGEYQKAITQFQEAYQITKHPTRLQNIARCYEMLKAYADSIRFTIEYVTQEKTAVASENQRLVKLVLPYLKAEKAIDQKDLDRWHLVFKDDKAFAGFTVFKLLAALTYIKIGLYPKASDLLAQSLTVIRMQNLGEAISDYLLQKGQVLFRSEKSQAAADLFKLAILVSPGLGDSIARGYMEKGAVDLKAGSLESALANYKLALYFAQSPDIKALGLKKVLEISERIRLAQRKTLVTTPQQIVTIEKEPGRKWSKREIAGWSLIGTGGAAMIASIVCFALSKQANTEADRNFGNYITATNQESMNRYYSDYQSTYKNYESYLTTGIVLGSVGILAVTVGLIAILVPIKRAQKKSERAKTRFSMRPVIGKNESGGMVMFQW